MQAWLSANQKQNSFSDNFTGKMGLTSKQEVGIYIQKQPFIYFGESVKTMKTYQVLVIIYNKWFR